MASGVMVVKSEVLLKQTVKYSQMHTNGAYEEKEKLKVGWQLIVKLLLGMAGD